MVIIATVIAVPVANAKPTSATQVKISFQLKRYYHADGFIKAIGHVAFRTIYNPNHAKRSAWQHKVHKLFITRSDAQHKLAALRQPARPPHYYAWLCIHKYEGAWNSTSNPDYRGGLQFGWHEWSTYGSKYAPTADQATPLEQMWAAEAYYNDSGFYPWPQTARICGLI